MDYIYKRIVFQQLFKITLLCVIGELKEDKAMASPVNVSLMPATNTDAYNENHSKKLTAPTCGGDLLASFEATSIEIPHLGKGEIITCKWKVTAPNPLLTIGVAFVNIVFNDPFVFNNTLTIDVYDGPDDKHQRKLYWSNIRNFDIFSPVVSSSGVIFITLTAVYGFGVLDAKLIYFLCGGTVQNDIEISSPIFNVTDAYGMPDLMECTWKLVKPKNAFYGYLHMHRLDVPFCDALSITTFNGDMLVNQAPRKQINHTAIITEQENNNASLRNKTFGFVRQQTDWNASTLHHYSANATHAHHMQICDVNIQVIAFNGSKGAILKYSIRDFQPHHGFSAGYVTIGKIGNHYIRNTPWYLDYAPVVIYMPLGLLMGSILIAIHSRRRGPSKKLVNNSDSDKLNSGSDHSTSDVNCECAVGKVPKSIMKSRSDDRGKGNLLQSEILFPADPKHDVTYGLTNNNTAQKRNDAGARNENEALLCHQHDLHHKSGNTFDSKEHVITSSNARCLKEICPNHIKRVTFQSQV